MELILQLKRLGKKRVISVPYVLEAVPATLKELIVACVTTEVKRYNAKREEIPLVSFLNPQQIEEQAEAGKIAFGDIDNLQQVVEDKALDTAFQAFEDGLFVVFIDGVEIKTLDEEVEIKDRSEVAFIRLTFLVGRR
ncbi:hypothetical protein [Sphingobacterium yanglingense]|uniref:Uncharacterized protein n=1 Tax=Sphingobacterium yanglingense TaxID=1437280 RepID=A0A4R6WK23_9SPHI|nr:hypothetical protein [Sphingobacterium yanglingense]TDQ79108.1 hypothetical protein CLV99_0540 [Sphingobacterium yanglingense]